MVKNLTNKKDLNSFVDNCKKEGKKIALVPTMGALHDGHIALIDLAKEFAEEVLVSIFINPLQFNNLQDFEKYPITLQKDLEKITNHGKATAVFSPNINDIYPEKIAINFNSELFKILCGKDRLGHFAGVCAIVVKLFNLTGANFAVFGEKDFQQLQIIRQLVKDFNFPIEIISLPTHRESSSRESSKDYQGLAMSSRNQRLSRDSLIKATALYRQMQFFASGFANYYLQYRHNNIKYLELIEIARDLTNVAKANIIDAGFDKIDYFTLMDEETLTDFTSQGFLAKIHHKKRIFVAATIDEVRLIDNLAII
jgi:pantoate--beta-alanine ligase